MNYSQLQAVLEETGMSPEKLAPVFSVANMTVRRWIKAPGNKKVSEVDQWNIIECIYKLVVDGKLSTESKAVQEMLRNCTPGSFEAITKGLGVNSAILTSKDDQQDKMMLMLSQIGGMEAHKKEVDHGAQKLSYFKKLGSEWQQRISGLTTVIQSKKLTTLEKLSHTGRYSI